MWAFHDDNNNNEADNIKLVEIEQPWPFRLLGVIRWVGF
jgi:hypothetical protein